VIECLWLGETIDFAVYGGYAYGDTPISAVTTMPDSSSS